MAKPKGAMTSLDLHFMRQELSALAGAHLNKFHRPGKGTFVIRLATHDGRRDLLVELGRRVHLAAELPENPQDPDSFVSFVRKHLANARLIGVIHPNFDRIIAFEFQKEAQWTLVFEMFKDGNVLVLKDGVIQMPLYRKEYRHRKLAKDEPYLPPPGGKDPTAMDVAGIAAVLASAEVLGKGLAFDLSLGPQGAEEVLARCGADLKAVPGSVGVQARRGADFKSVPGSVGAEMLNALAGEVAGILSTPLSPRVYSSGGVQSDFSAFEMSSKRNADSEPFPTFSQAVERYFKDLPRAEDVDEEAEALRRTVESQNQRVAELEAEALELQAGAEFLYVHYQELEAVLAVLREAAAVKGWQTLSSAELHPAVVRVDPKARTAVVRLSAEGPELTLEIEKDLNANASMMYDAVKKAKSRVDGARQAMAETLARLEERESAPEEKAKPKQRRREWYENHRWTYTSDGLLIVSGKDARGNEKVVSKYLRDGDRYVHADLPGAPSTIVRKGEGEIPETSLEEACTFAVVHSKAWKMGIGSASAYWVTPSQVSKTPNAGEFVAKGSFIIRGKRNYVHKIELSCAVGVGDIDGARKVMSGHVRAVSARCPEMLVLAPGNVEKEDLANALSQAWGVPQDDVLASLPPGPCEIKEAHGFTMPEVKISTKRKR